MEELKRKWQQQIYNRLRGVAVLLFVAVFGIFARLVYIQYIDEDIPKTSAKIHRRLITTDTLYATKGSILARDGKPLAKSILRRSIALDLASEGCDNEERFIRNADSLSKMLAQYFGEHSAKHYYDILVADRNKNRRVEQVGMVPKADTRSPIVRLLFPKVPDSVPVYKTKRYHRPTYLFGHIDQNDWEQISSFPILNGSLGQVLYKEYIDSRIYPHGNLARRTIGRDDKNFKQEYGIERAYRDTLASQKGLQYLQYMAPNFNPRIENDTLKTTPAQRGADIVTTIDIELQDVADRALRQSLTEQNGEWGTTVVMECATGDILAMVNLGRTTDGRYVETTNHALATTIEPGSTIKLATTIILLDKAGMSPDKKYNSGYGRTVKVGKNEVKDAHAIGSKRDPRIDLRTAFTESANVYFVKAVKENFDHRPNEYYDALCALHLNEHTSLTEFGMPAPFVPKPKSDKWYATTLGLMSFGYGLEITPLQTLTLYNAIANNGTMVAPRLIREFRRDEVVTEVPVKVVEQQICTPQTLALVRSYLENVAQEGTAKDWLSGEQVPFAVGAKTGTATIAKGHKYSDAYHLGSLVTYMPADNPKYTFITAIYKRKGKGSIFGATIAGPVQKKIATYLHNRSLEWAPRLLVGEVKQLPTDVKGGNIEHICRVTQAFNLAASYTSPTGWGTTTTGISSVTIASTAADTRVVPNVLGMGLSDALFMLEQRGLKVRFSGQGKVVEQSLAPDTPITKQRIITIKLE